MYDEYLKEKIRENAERLVLFFKERGVELKNSNSFVTECTNNALAAGNHLTYLGRKDVKNAIDMADFWKPALAGEEEYETLIKSVIYSMYRIQTFACNNNVECERLYIGRFCKVDPFSKLARGSREYNLKRTYVGVGSKSIVKA